ncbi:MAG TPA: DUF4337 domain-containing protein [Pyrinomonadaceae bacterium]|nr:DUF4337 domain-containing protein [Pyrinomonadaceae bacterium]
MEPAEQIAEARARGESAEEGDNLNSTAAIVIALMAMLLALTSLGGGNAAEDIMNHNIHASDTWAFYQAKNIRQTAYRLAADDLESELQMQAAASPEARQAIERRIQQYRETAARYEDEPDPAAPADPLRGEGKKQLTARARDFETQRDRAQAQDPNFDFAEALFQIAIVLASVAILASSRRILWGSVGVGALAAVLMLNGYFLFFELPF